jgi:excisionase family DNA binding protein
MLGPPRNAPRAVSQQPSQLVERDIPPADWMDAPKQLLTLEEAGRILRVGRTTVWEMVNAGELVALRIRRKLLIPREEPERYLADLIEHAPAAAETRKVLYRKHRRPD